MENFCREEGLYQALCSQKQKPCEILQLSRKGLVAMTGSPVGRTFCWRQVYRNLALLPRGDKSYGSSWTRVGCVGFKSKPTLPSNIFTRNASELLKSCR